MLASFQHILIAHRQEIKVGLAAAALAMVFVYYVLERWRVRRFRWIPGGVLAALAVASVAAYAEFGGLRFGLYMNPHDVFHYYTGAKYSEETDYFNLYRCCLIADWEQKKVFRGSVIRNLNTHVRTEHVRAVLAKAEDYKAPFTEERWKEFKKDVLYFQSLVPSWKWNRMLTDKGYNATPVWNAVAQFLTRRISTDNRWGMALLVALDPILLVLMFAAILWAFGWRVMAFAIIFFGTSYMTAFPHIKGAFLRLDWVACLIMAICLVKKNRYKTAGGLMAYSAMARVFPAVFLYGLAAKCSFRGLRHAYDALRGRWFASWSSRDTRYLAFFVTFAMASLVLIGLTWAYEGDLQRWGSFADKISVHNADISTTRVGFKYIFLWPVKSFGGKGVAFGEKQAVWRLIMLSVLIAGLIGVFRIEDYEAIAYGFVPAFFLAAPTFYYYVMLIVLVLLFVPKIDRFPRAVGAAGLFGITAAAFLYNRHVPMGFGFCFWLSCVLLGLVGYTVAVCTFARKASAEQPDAPETPTDEQEEATATVGDEEEAGDTESLAERRPKRSRMGWLLAAGAALLVLVVAAGYWMITSEDVAPNKPANGQPLSESTAVDADNATEEPISAVASRKRAGEVELALVGDVMLARNVARSLDQAGRDFTFPFLRVAPYLRRADIAFCNLESPISTRGERVEKNYTFRARPAAVEGLAYAGFDVVSLANNHILDYGPVCLSDTRDYIAGKGMKPIGVSTNDAPQQPFLFEADGVKVAFLAYADPHPKYAYAKEFLRFETKPAKGTRDTIQHDINTLKGKADVIVVSMHWGVEYNPEPYKEQVELGHFIVDAGAHIVAGHHAHVQQRAEVYHGGLILFSMGNFVFDQHTRPLTRVSRLYRVFANKNGFVRAEYLPLTIPKALWQPMPEPPQRFVEVASSK